MEIGKAKHKNNGFDPLAMVGIAELSTRLYRTLSGGQKQKTNIARCLAQKTELMLLDEPDSFLDHESQREIMSILSRLNREQGLTIVMISHDLSLVMSFSTRIYVLENRRLTEYGGNP